MKVAISLPTTIFIAAEELAEELHVSRSRLYAQALAQYLESLGGSSVTAKLNAVYRKESSAIDPAISRAQSKVLANEAW